MESIYDSDNHIYTRCKSIDRTALELKIQSLYNAKNAYICSSGMNALYLTLRSIGEYGTNTYNNCTILASNELYCETKSKILMMIQKEYPQLQVVEFQSGNTVDLINKINLYKNTLVCIFTEGASNPSGKMVDWNQITPVIPKKCYLIVDNTWLTPVIFNPFSIGADVVVDSCTKYLSGGTCIAGIVCFAKKKDRLANTVDFLIRVMGIHVPSNSCKLVSNGLDTLTNRLEIVHINSTFILQKLQHNDFVETIMHQSMPAHESHVNYMKYTSRQASGVIWFYVKFSNMTLNEKAWKSNLGQILKNNGIRYETSFGAPHYLVDKWPVKKNNTIGLRLSIGYEEDPNEFYNKLEKAIVEINITNVTNDSTENYAQTKN